MEDAKEQEESPKGGAGHTSLLRQAVNNRSEDTRLKPVSKTAAVPSVNSPRTPPAVRSHSVSGEGMRTPSPKPRGNFSHRSGNNMRSNQQGRENSPAPNLADLEFPPPPPPLDDDPVSSAVEEAASESSRTSSERQHHQQSRPIPSPRGQLKTTSLNVQLRASSVDRLGPSRTGQSEGEDPFFLGEEVSVEENSLKKNIESNRTNRDGGRNDSPNTTAESANSGGLATSKSADSLASSDMLDRSSVGPFSPPDEPDGNRNSGGIMSQSIFGILRTPSWEDNLQTPEQAKNSKRPTPRGPRQPDAQQPVAELKEKKDPRRTPLSSSSMENLGPINPPSVNLVSELFENLRLKAGKKPGSTSETQTDHSSQEVKAPQGDMAPPRPTHPAPPRATTAPHSGSKKVDLKAANNPAADPSQENSPAVQHGDAAGPKFDFKSRLRKVGNDKPAEVEPSPALKSTAPAVENKSAENSDDVDEMKRKSSGSINSLKRMWERDQQLQQQQQQQQQQHHQQQRISLKAGGEPMPSNKPPPPPQQLPGDKPIVPVKPSNVAVKPMLPKSNASAAIYATPTASVINTSPAKPPVVPASSNGARTSAVYAKSPALVIPSSGGEAGGEERQKILNLCSEAEHILSQSHSTPTQWMDKLASLHSQCHTYADSIAPHGRFHFRQLIAKLESQAKEMKQTSSTGPLRNSSEHSRLIGDVKNTVRDLANALQR